MTTVEKITARKPHARYFGAAIWSVGLSWYVLDGSSSDGLRWFSRLGDAKAWIKAVRS